jgi:hypothetical protein
LSPKEDAAPNANLLDLKEQCVIISPHPSTEQAPQPPPIDIEDTTGHPGTMNIDQEPLFGDELTQAAAAQVRGRRVSKRTSNYTTQEDKMLVDHMNERLDLAPPFVLGAIP